MPGACGAAALLCTGTCFCTARSGAGCRAGALVEDVKLGARRPGRVKHCSAVPRWSQRVKSWGAKGACCTEAHIGPRAPPQALSPRPAAPLALSAKAATRCAQPPPPPRCPRAAAAALGSQVLQPLRRAAGRGRRPSATPADACRGCDGAAPPLLDHPGARPISAVHQRGRPGPRARRRPAPPPPPPPPRSYTGESS
jgi:hypothetical protein